MDMKSLKKADSIVLMLFVCISSFLMALAVIIVVNVFSALDDLYELANPPHFIQLHKGAVDENALAQLAADDNRVTAYQIVEMIDIDGGDIEISSPDTTFNLSGSVLDNGFVFNHPQYDSLLNNSNQYIEMETGQIGLPLIYKESYDIEEGDELRIQKGDFTMNFIVTEFIRDAQMNSTMCSSTRFLVSRADFEKMDGCIGENGAEIEYFFDDPGYATKFLTNYENSGLPGNGQAITYRIMKLLSSFSYYMIALIIGLISVGVILISLVCIRYSIRSSMKDERRQIGTLRAIGLSVDDILSVYLKKYRMIAGIGSLLGLFLALIGGNVFF